MISNWKEWIDAKIPEDPATGYVVWQNDEELRPLMTPKFRRLHDRVQRRIRRMDPEWRVIVGFSRQYVEVTARKHRARRRRKRR